MIFILLVYDYKYSSSQTCSLKYRFQALENISRGMSGPTVAGKQIQGGVTHRREGKSKYEVIACRNGHTLWRGSGTCIWRDASSTGTRHILVLGVTARRKEHQEHTSFRHIGGVHFSWHKIDSLAKVIVIKRLSITFLLVDYSGQLKYLYRYFTLLAQINTYACVGKFQKSSLTWQCFLFNPTMKMMEEVSNDFGTKILRPSNLPDTPDLTLFCLILENRNGTVRLSSNDHPEMGGLISQLLDFKTRCFEVALSPLGIQGLHATFAWLIPSV